MRSKVKRVLKAIGSFFETMWSGKASRVLLLIAGVLLIAAVVVAVCLFDEGVVAQSNAQKLVQAYNEAVSDESTSELSAVPAETTQADAVPVTIEGYQVIGKLEISKIEAELPVIAFTDDEALKVSVCYYQGPMPDEAGNLVITGHNFASGAHFGRLEELKKGDSVVFSTPDGSVYSYTVTGTQEIKPDDTSALEGVTESHELTLLTCTSHGNRRLIVRCAMQGA